MSAAVADIAPAPTTPAPATAPATAQPASPPPTNMTTTTTAPATPPSASATSKGRKGTAAGGGKAWTEAEEVYLLQMRLDRVAYKKIAAHLSKTELACRLHYHQLSHGGNRRKRTTSVSSTASSNSNSSNPPSPPAPSFCPVNANGAIQKASSAQRTPKPKGKPLLPKPVTTPRKNNKAGLKISCGSPIDAHRLRDIVKAHENAFWEAIAQQYGGAVNAEDLKRVWREDTGYGPETPPTPGVSPKAEEVAEFSMSPVDAIAEEDDDVEMTNAPAPETETEKKVKEEVDTPVSSPTPTPASVTVA